MSGGEPPHISRGIEELAFFLRGIKMAMKIGTNDFKDRVDSGISNAFMRGAVSGAQERLQTRRLDVIAGAGKLGRVAVAF